MTEKHEFPFYFNESILAENISSETLDQIPLFRIAENLLHIIKREKHLKLTKTGALPVKIVVELYSKRHLVNDLIELGYGKLRKEEDSIEIRTAKNTAQLAGLVKKVHGKMTLTNVGTKLLEKNNRLEIFKKFFDAFTEKFEWSHNDYYPEYRIGQYEWEYSVLMLNLYGNQPIPAQFYAEKYAAGFPGFLTVFEGSYFTTPLEQYYRCYELRTFRYFFTWFGLVKITNLKPEKRIHVENLLYEKSAIFDKVFDTPEVKNDFRFSAN